MEHKLWINGQGAESYGGNYQITKHVMVAHS